MAIGLRRFFVSTSNPIKTSILGGCAYFVTPCAGGNKPPYLEVQAATNLLSQVQAATNLLTLSSNGN